MSAPIMWALIAKQWVHLIDREIKRQELPATIIAFVHDEIQISVQQQQEGVADHVGTLTRRMAEEAGRTFDFRVPIEAEYNCWTNMGRHSLTRTQEHIAAIYSVVQAKIKPFTTKSDFARTWANVIASSCM